MSPCRQFPIKDDGFFVSEGRAVTPFPTALFEPFPTPTFRENRRHGAARTRRKWWDECPTQYVFRDVLLLHHYLSDAALTALKDNVEIAKIAELLGYESPVAFHKAFKREVGMTPARYRKLG